MKITKTILPVFVLTLLSLSCQREDIVEKWDYYEITLSGPEEGNPYTEVTLTATFKHSDISIDVTGFYDGHGAYKIRYMPDAVGKWNYITRSNVQELDSVSGQFQCVSPEKGNKGPVQVTDTYHFEYADGTPFYQIGTTCYAWIHQGDSLEEVTLETLKKSPFNKIRMCIFPKDYAYNQNEPVYHPFRTGENGENDYKRFNPEFWKHLEKRVLDLMELGIEADIILFHPYDRWGYANMGAENDDFYLKYVIARLSSFRNVWWSLANEFDFMEHKSMNDWHRFFKIIVEHDPYHKLRSIHNGRVMYDHSLPWVSHASIQSTAFDEAAEWRKEYKKPLIYDECRYEGDIIQGWGNLSAREMTSMFWKSLATGTYAGHGETYMHPEDILWWSKGGILHGESPQRIAFFKKFLEEIPAGGLSPFDEYSSAKHEEQYIYYFGEEMPGKWTFHLPENIVYDVEIIDTWNMTVQKQEGFFEKKFTIDLPGKKYMAVRIQKAGYLIPVAVPEIVHHGEKFIGETMFEIYHPNIDQVRYTMDGSEPDINSLVYEGPVKIDKSVTVKAKAFTKRRSSKTDAVVFEAVTSFIPALNIQNPKNGIGYTYYEGDWTKLPEFSELESVSTGLIDDFDITVAEREEEFGIVFQGLLSIPEDNLYTFYLNSDDGSRLIMHDKIIVDNDMQHAPTEKSGQVALAKGYHEFKILFFENSGGQVLEVYFKGEGSSKKPVDAKQLFHRN